MEYYERRVDLPSGIGESDKPEFEIKSADMQNDMIEDAKEIIKRAVQKYSIEKDIAMYIKNTFDNKYESIWHVIVGKSFASYVTHYSKHYLYIYYGELTILIYKFG
ncbi:hypothetical protein PPERSA_01834 [Pseudocohnilembus persalinus]|uniref:Dynein light chain n=1 Tax=Pseudocohnilembus persalinus TaxID=266149 RepID=A0A0V0QKC5_PSEPJ|nr:hypothetical protein PPERSA_01834 [Pseudocohnilembus persalinus]|eukprot:KRX02717.1 hypothetical protein PPERSA_01834 [Pseudocohnilembus persalinus]